MNLQEILNEDGPSQKQHAEIQKRAYFRWIDAGKPNGNSLQFWLDAELSLYLERKSPGVQNLYINHLQHQLNYYDYDNSLLEVLIQKFNQNKKKQEEIKNLIDHFRIEQNYFDWVRNNWPYLFKDKGPFSKIAIQEVKL